MAERYRFTDDFQDLILACMAAHPEKFMAVGAVVEPKYFWSQESAVTCEEMQNYAAVYKTYPTLEVLTQLVVEHYTRDEQDKADEARVYVKKLMKLKTRDVDSVVAHAVEFAREMALIRAVQEAAQRLHENDWPEEGFAPMFDKAMRIGDNLTDIGYSAVDDVDKVLDKVMSVEYGVCSGFKELDKLWHGRGWGPGWLVVPLAPPKSYKTGLCLNFALNITRSIGSQRPGPVFYYACEISAELALMRAYSHVTKWPSQDIYSRSKQKLFRRQLKDTLATTFGAPLLVKSFPAKTATIADIRAHAMLAMSQLTDADGKPLKPSAIIIDHAETIKPMLTGKNVTDWRQQADIYTRARALGQELECVVIMPDRCTRQAAERATPSMTGFQGAFEKAGIVDVAIGICQTPEERATNICTEKDGEGKPLYQMNAIRYFVFLNRHGREYAMYDGTVKPETMELEIGEEITWQSNDDGPRAKRRSTFHKPRGNKTAPLFEEDNFEELLKEPKEP